MYMHFVYVSNRVYGYTVEYSMHNLHVHVHAVAGNVHVHMYRLIVNVVYDPLSNYLQQLIHTCW